MRANEFIQEAVNPETFKTRFKHQVEIGGYLYKADVFYMEYNMGKALRIRCFDGNKKIGQVLFKNYGDRIESDDTHVNVNYRGEGIATNMYAYAKMLGNDIFPSFIRTNQGKDMWNNWIRSKQAKHITPPGHNLKIAEVINPDSVKPGFTKEKWIMGKFLMKAKAVENPENPNVQGIIVKVYDPETKSAWLRAAGIGMARFIVMDDHMEVSFTNVSDEYQRQGIASAMYQFARELGNDVKPSKARSDDAKAFWNAGAGVGRDFPNQPPEPKQEPEPEIVQQPTRKYWLGRLRDLVK